MDTVKLWRGPSRKASGGCQYKCIACGNLCPTAAIRPLALDERMGKNTYAGSGPIRIGMAFIDRGRCLPWSMDIPCIVCQENCPVSPKAIVTRTVYSTVVTSGDLTVSEADETLRQSIRKQDKVLNEKQQVVRTKVFEHLARWEEDHHQQFLEMDRELRDAYFSDRGFSPM